MSIRAIAFLLTYILREKSNKRSKIEDSICPRLIKYAFSVFVKI